MAELESQNSIIKINMFLIVIGIPTRDLLSAVHQGTMSPQTCYILIQIHTTMTVTSGLFLYLCNVILRENISIYEQIVTSLCRLIHLFRFLFFISLAIFLILTAVSTVSLYAGLVASGVRPD